MGCRDRQACIGERKEGEYFGFFFYFHPASIFCLQFSSEDGNANFQVLGARLISLLRSILRLLLNILLFSTNRVFVSKQTGAGCCIRKYYGDLEEEELSFP